MTTEEEIKATEEAEAKAKQDAEAKAAEEARVADEEAAKAEAERVAAEEAARKKGFQPNSEAALHEAREQNRLLREQNQHLAGQMRRITAPADTKEFDDILGEGGTMKLKKLVREESLRSVVPFIKPLYQGGIETRKEQLRAENPAIWAQVSPEIESRLNRIRQNGQEPITGDVDDAYNSAIGKLTRAGKFQPRTPAGAREILGDVRHNTPGSPKPPVRIIVTPEVKAEAVRMGVSEASAAEILDNRKKLQATKK